MDKIDIEMLSEDFPGFGSESDAQIARQRCEASVVRMDFNVALMLSQYECCVCLEHISPPKVIFGVLFPYLN